MFTGFQNVANAMQTACQISQAQILSTQTIELPGPAGNVVTGSNYGGGIQVGGKPVVPFKEGNNAAAPYPVQPIMGNFAGGTFYPYPTNNANAVPVANVASSFTGGRPENWPDPQLLIEISNEITLSNYNYRI